MQESWMIRSNILLQKARIQNCLVILFLNYKVLKKKHLSIIIIIKCSASLEISLNFTSDIVFKL